MGGNPRVDSVLRGLGAGVSLVRSVVWNVRYGSSTGQGLAEYALILALIAVISIVALTFLGTGISSILSRVGKTV